MELIGLAALNLVVVLVYLLQRAAARMSREQAVWFNGGLAAASEQLGVRFASRGPRTTKARGTVGPYSVSVELRVEIIPPDRDNEVAARAEFLQASVSGGLIPRGMSFVPERDSGDDILTGDPLFDDRVEVHGEPSVVLARLDEAVRTKVRRLVSDGGWLADGDLVFHAPTRYASHEIPRALRTLLDLADDLGSTEGGGLYLRLARNACQDSVPGVRLWNLMALQEGFALGPEVRDASRQALHDSSPWVRLAAARFLRDGERKTLEGLVQDPAVPDQAASEAVALLAARAPAAEVGPLLVSVLKTRTGETRKQAIEELGRLRHAPAFGPLVVLLERSDPGTAAAAARALGALGDPRAEPSLLEALEAAARELRLAAARALSAVGSVGAVEPLLSRLEARGQDAECRQAIREAIGAIQSRLGGAEAAQLSLVTAPPEGGRLTLAHPGPGPGDLSSVSKTGGP
jgi:HEAT repeat protein